MCQHLDLWLQTWTKTHTADSHDTISDAVKQFCITPMGPMIGVVMFPGILMAHQCQATTHFQLGCVKIWFSDFKLQTWAKIHTADSHCSISVTAKQFHITSMGPMIDVVMSQGILMASQWQAMTPFELGCVKIWIYDFKPSQTSHCWQPWHYIWCYQTVLYHTYGINDWCCDVPQDFDGSSVPSHGTFWAGMCQHLDLWLEVETWTKTHTADSHDTISDAVKQFCITPMGPMIDVVMSPGILMAHQCQTIAHFELESVKIWFSDLKLKPEPKLTLLTAMTPYLMLSNSFASHLWDQWLVLWCPQGFWWLISAKTHTT
jgi:hypothetical protein